MQTVYCHSYNGERVTTRAVEPDYAPAAGEHLSSPEPAAAAQLETWFPGSTLSALKLALISAASASCTFVSRQIATTETQLAGFQNAAAVVDASGDPPTVEPAASAFAALAASYGMTAAQLARLVSAVRATAMDLLALQAGASMAAYAATSKADLGRALTAFEAGIKALVDGLNAAGLTTTISEPPAIVIPGIND